MKTEKGLLKEPKKKQDRSKQASRVTIIGSFVNIFLAIVKITVGILGRSSAMIADGVHSFSDLLTDIAVLIGFRMVKKPRDESHDWGHGKFETLITVIIGIFLLIVGAGLVYSGGLSIYRVITGEKLQKPGLIALSGALISILLKELIYRYTVHVGKEIDSKAIIANAWHHRTDALSSVATLFGVGGAILLGGNWTVLDPIAALIVSLLIFKVSYDVIKDGLLELTEASLDTDSEEKIKKIIDSTPGVLHSHELKTRRIGAQKAIDVHIHVSRDLDIVEAHDISTEVDRRLKEEFGEDSFVSVHTEPCDGLT